MRPQQIERVGVLTCDNFDEILRRIFKERERTDEDKYHTEYLRLLHERYGAIIDTDEWPLRAVTTRLNAEVNFKDCDRALYTSFAALCRVDPVKGADFACVCGQCDQ